MSYQSRTFKQGKKKPQSIDLKKANGKKCRRKPGKGLRRGIRNKKRRERLKFEAAHEEAQRQRHFKAMGEARRIATQQMKQAANLIPLDEAGDLILQASGRSVRMDDFVPLSMFMVLDQKWNNKYGKSLPFSQPIRFSKLHVELKKALDRQKDPLWQWIFQVNQSRKLYLAEDDQAFVPEYAWGAYAAILYDEFNIEIPDYNPINSPSVGDLYKELKRRMLRV